MDRERLGHRSGIDPAQFQVGHQLHGNQYIYSRNGMTAELVSIGGNEYRMKVDDGSFVRFINSGSAWTAYTKDGRISYFGTTAASRQDDPTGTKIFKWGLDRVQDTNGNYMALAYQKDQGALYLVQINYAGNSLTNLQPTNQINFNLTTGRTDLYAGYGSGFAVTYAKRLASIAVTGNGLSSRRYELAYTQSPGTGISRLSSVVQKGSDDITALPATIFDYQNKAKSLELDEAVGGHTIGYDTKSGGFRMGDINGDGKADFIYSKNKEMHVLLSIGDTFTDDLIWGVRSHTIETQCPGLRVADVNGDGLADVIYDNSKNMHVLLSTGSGFTADTVWGSRTKSYTDLDTTGFRMADVNGDGMADVIYDNSSNMRVLLSTGNGFQADALWGKRLKSIGSESGGFQMTDVNGDGLADMIYDNNKSIRVLLSTGSGFQTETIWGYRTEGFPAAGTGFRLSDVNGDGLPDFIYDSSTGGDFIRVSLNSGSSFPADIAWGKREHAISSNSGGYQMADMNGDGMADFVYDSSQDMRVLLSTGKDFLPDTLWGNRLESYRDSSPGFRLADMNGDGLADIVYDTDSGGGYVHALRNTPDYPDLLAEVVEGRGAVYTIEYMPSSAYVNTLMPYIVQTVSSLAVDDGLGMVTATGYEYGGGFHDFIDREFRGFNYVKKTNPDMTTLETWVHQMDYDPRFAGSGYCYNEPGVLQIPDDKDLRGKPCRTEQRAPWVNEMPGTLLSETNHAWGIVTPPGAAPMMFAKLLSKSSVEYPGGAAVQRNEANTYDDTNGNLLSTTVSGTDAEKVVTATQYQNFGTWLWRPLETDSYRSFRQWICRVRTEKEDKI